MQPTARGIRLFELFGTPVYADPSYFLLLVFFGFGYLEEGMGAFFMVAFAVTASLLVHEFGHVFAAKTNGFQSVVMLWGMGGMTYPSGMARGWRSVWMSMAGPLAGLFLWAVTWFVFMPPWGVDLGLKTDLGAVLEPYRAIGPYQLTLGDLLWMQLCWINLVWSILNLLPVFPLDGGQVLRSLLLMRFRAYEADRMSALVGTVVGALAGVFLWMTLDSVLSLVIFGFLAFQNWQRYRLSP